MQHFSLKKFLLEHCECTLFVRIEGKLSYYKWSSEQLNQKFTLKILAEAINWLLGAEPFGREWCGGRKICKFTGTIRTGVLMYFAVQIVQIMQIADYIRRIRIWVNQPTFIKHSLSLIFSSFLGDFVMTDVSITKFIIS